MATFRTAVQCGSHTITVESDNYPDFHRAVASLVELDRAADPLRALGAEGVALENHRAGSYEYFGFIDTATGRSVSFGEATEPRSPVPFFPKPDEGVYDPATKRREPAVTPSARPAAAADPTTDDDDLVRTVTADEAAALRKELRRYNWQLDAARLLMRHFGAESPEDLDRRHHASAMAAAASVREQQRWTQLAERAGAGARETTRTRSGRTTPRRAA